MTKDKTPYAREESKGLRVLGKTCSNFAKNFTQGTSQIADAILDERVPEKKEKIRKVKDASRVLFKNLFSDLKQDLSKLSILDVMADSCYEIGKLSAASLKAGEVLWEGIAQKLDEDKTR